MALNGPVFNQGILPIALNGPIATNNTRNNEHYQRLQMGPDFPVKHSTDDLQWASLIDGGPYDSLEWAWSFWKIFYQWPHMSPVLPVECLANSVKWAQYNWQVTLSMALNRPSILQNRCYRGFSVGPVQLAGWPNQWLWMGPAFLTGDNTDSVRWAQCCQWNMHPMILNGPNAIGRWPFQWPWMGPIFLKMCPTDGLQWAQQELLPRVLNGPSISYKR